MLLRGRYKSQVGLSVLPREIEPPEADGGTHYVFVRWTVLRIELDRALQGREDLFPGELPSPPVDPAFPDLVPDLGIVGIEPSKLIQSGEGASAMGEIRRVIPSPPAP